MTTVLFESSGPNELALRRRGYIDGNVTVNCILKGITASGGYTPQDDFFIPLTPQSVTFLPRETEKCEDWFMKFNPPATTHPLSYSAPPPPSPPPIPPHSACSIYIRDDSLYEGVESFLAKPELAHSNEPGAIILTPTTFYIVDPEDGKV